MVATDLQGAEAESCIPACLPAENAAPDLNCPTCEGVCEAARWEGH